MAERKRLLQCSRFEVEQVTESLPNGYVRTREVVRHPGAVVILPLLAPDHVCLIRNYRVAIEETLFELPAGTREPEESAEITAIRELSEETGLKAARCDLFGRFFPSPGITDEEMYLFVASELTESNPHREPGEQIENYILPLDDALEMIDEGTIRDAKTICGLLLWQRRSRARSTAQL